MSEHRIIRVQLRAGILGWALAAAGLLIAMLIAVFAVGVLLFVVPILLAAGMIQYALWRWRFRRALRQQMQNAKIIDGDYRVVDPEHEPEPPSRRIT